MKNLLLCLYLCLGLAPLLAMPTAKSIFYADSYMLRAYGVEANYWNPAKLSNDGRTEIWLPLSNTAIYASNNSLDLDTYNYFVSRDTLFAGDKIRLLDKIDGGLRLSSNGTASIFGFARENVAISASAKIYVKGALAEDYVKILLYGNTEDSYEFVRSDTNFSSLAYTDITYGIGDYTLPFIPEPVPAIKAGFSVSLLTGIYSIDTQEYNGHITNSLNDGLSSRQEIKLRAGLGGIGFKGMLGLYSEITPAFEAGITLDNIAGFLHWGLKTEMECFCISADSVFVSNISEDFFVQETERIDIDPFTSSLPPQLRLAAMYKHKYAVVSADWVHGFKETASTSAIGTLSLAASFLPLKAVGLSWGISLPNSRNPVRVSYGIDFKTRISNFGLAVQSYDSLLPGYKSKGVSLGLFANLGF